MPNYYWKAVNPMGQIKEGALTAPNKKIIWNYLKKQDLIILKIKRNLKPETKINRTWVYHFTFQLATLLTAKISLSSTFDILIKTEKNTHALSILNHLQEQIGAGQSLHQALHPFRYFSETYRAFIQAGENTGQLSTVLHKLVIILEKQLNLRSEIKKALSYPIFLFAMLNLMLIGIGFFILPRYQSFFAELGGHLPILTLALLHLSFFLQKYIGFLLLFLLFTIFIITFLMRKHACQRLLQAMLLRIPIINNLLKLTNLLNWSFLMALAIQTHVPILQALHLANQSMSNHALKASLDLIIRELKHGRSLHDSLCTTHLFSLANLQMIYIGETTGDLGCSFSQMAHHMEHALQANLDRLTKFSGPIIMILLAITIGILLTALYLPMLNLGLSP